MFPQPTPVARVRGRTDPSRLNRSSLHGLHTTGLPTYSERKLYRSHESRLAARALAALLSLTVVVDAAHYDLYLVSGQSNAVGYDAPAPLLPVDNVDASIPFFFDCGDPPYDTHDSTSGGIWTNLCAQPKGNPLPYDSNTRQYGNFSNYRGGFGPEIAIGRTLYKSGRTRPAVIKFAYSGTGFAQSDWNKGDTLNTAMLARFQTAKSLLENGGKNTVQLKGLFWIQGENDVGFGQNSYETRFRTFISNLRTDLATPDLLVFAGFNTNFYGNTAEIVRAQKAVAAADSRVFYVETGGAPLTGPPPVPHFNAAGTMEIGTRFANAFLQTFPKISSPAYSSGFFRFTVSSPSNWTFEVQSSANLSNWITLSTITNLSGADAVTLSNEAATMFYRLRLR